MGGAGGGAVGAGDGDIDLYHDRHRRDAAALGVAAGLYLASFIIAFATRRGPADTLTRIAPVTLLLFGGVIMGSYPERAYANVVVALLLLFMVSVALHTAMYRARPGSIG